MSEEWRAVPGFPNYEVSSLGRVRSLDHTKWGGPVVGYYLHRGRLLKHGIASNGYPTVVLGRGHSRTVHSLVAEAFIGPCLPGQEVRHKDDERWNASLANLEYGTRRDNVNDAYSRKRRNPVEYGHKAAATKDAKYPGWRKKVFQPIKFSRKEADK